MPEPEFKIAAHKSPAYYHSLDLREEILRAPLGLTVDEDEVESEADHTHVLGFLEKEICSSCVLVLSDDYAKMQRVVVAPGHQNMGIGSKMMTFCEEYLTQQHCAKIVVHARDTAVKFYLNNNYQAQGDYFDEDGIPHLKMVKILKDS